MNLFLHSYGDISSESNQGFQNRRGDAVLAWYNYWGLGCAGPGEPLMVHEGLKKIMAFEQGRIYIMSQLLWHMVSVFAVVSDSLQTRVLRTHTNLNPHTNRFYVHITENESDFIRSFQLIISHNIWIPGLILTFKILKKMMHWSWSHKQIY